jgi:hypothetical protein
MLTTSEDDNDNDNDNDDGEGCWGVRMTTKTATLMNDSEYLFCITTKIVSTNSNK